MRGPFLRVGLLLVLGGAVFAALLVFLGGTRIRDGITYESYFGDSVQGLDVGAPLKYRGVTLGRVTDIGLVSAEYGRDQPELVQRRTFRLVLVRYVVDISRLGSVPRTEEAVREGLRARVAPQGLTGLAYVELDFFPPDRYPVQPVPWTPRYDVIPSAPSTLSQVQDSAQAVLARLQETDFKSLVDGLTGLVGDLRGQLDAGDAHALLGDARALLGQLRDQLAAADLPGLAGDLRRTSASLRGVAEGRQTRELLTAATAAADRFATAAGRLPALLASLEAVAARAGNSTADLQAELGPVLRDARAAVANLRDTTEALRRDPGQVVLGAPPPRQGRGR